MFDTQGLMSRFNACGLSKRETEVALLMIKGFNEREIARKLFVEVRTIKFHKTNIYKKCRVYSQQKFVVWCLQPILLNESK